MVDTATLTKIRERVDAAGARLVLTGDPEQLDAIGAGGAMELAINAGADTFELDEVRRFANQWEATASLRPSTPAQGVNVRTAHNVMDARSDPRAGYV